MIRDRFLWLLFLWLSIYSPLLCAQPTETIVTSSGQKIEVRAITTGQSRWYKTQDGFAVVRTPDRYEYAFQAPDGGLIASGILAGSIQGKLPFASGIRPTSEFMQKQRSATAIGNSPPNPNPIEIKQPNGATLKVVLKGSPAYNWYEDVEGYTLVQTRGRFEYALLNREAKLVPCGIEVGAVDPDAAGIRAGLEPK